MTDATVGWTADNPFSCKSKLPFEAPPFDRIEEAHFLPAFTEGMAQHRAEVQRIQRQFGASLVELEQKRGSNFNLRKAVEDTIKASQAKLVRTAEADGPAPKPKPVEKPGVEKEESVEGGAYRVVVLCEVVPQDLTD